MRRLAALVALGLVAAGCGSGTSTPTTTSPADTVTIAPSPGVERVEVSASAPVTELVSGLNDAGFDLWRTQSLEGNLVFSPSSIGHALLMARAAADDATGAAIDSALALPSGVGGHEAWNAIDQMIAAAANAEDEVTVTIADRIWPRLDVEPDQGWIDLLTAQHGVSTEALDFANDTDASTERINSWVSDQTDGLISELLSEGFLKPTTVLVLTDTLYFKARWERVFGKFENVTDDFTRLDGTTVETEFLRELELDDPRGAGDGYVGAEVPYVGGEFSMLLIVPDEGRFEEIRERLGQDMIDEIDASFTTGPYELLMPPWKTTSQFDLIGWLTDLGAAPGSYPAISPDAFLGAAVHGADIAVDEWGTVAAAATAFGFEESGPPEPELTISADQPFLYLIRHRPTGVVLFAGQVVDPAG